MYAVLKKIAKSWLPDRWLFKHELRLRKLYGFRFKGRAFQCNVCETGLSGFIPLTNGEKLCPFCGSLPRNRRLWQLLTAAINSATHPRVLDFSPSRCLYRAMKKMQWMDYVSTDFAGEFFADRAYDITAIPEQDRSFDYLICYHVLEHITDGRKAISELFRTLKNGGKAFIQTPFKDGEIYEDPTINSKAGRLLHFGQEDHVRVYSVDGLKHRLEDAGFIVEKRTFSDGHDEKATLLGLNASETILISSKPARKF